MSWVFWGLIFLVVGWVIWTYNGLVALQHQIQNAWKQLEVQLKRRYDLIPNLVESVKGYMSFEQETLEKVIEARSRAMASTGVKETAQAQSDLTQSLGRIFALMESYPELKSNENVLRLQEELTTTENRLAFARQYYNDLVMRFNLKQEVFPSNVVASFFRFRPSEFFNVPDDEKVVPRVNLTLPT
ncbi:MAG TPA: LemA family protein [candidate division Zixibacteria bacterium]|nr:LemA family protein [candidate division Zixibacteria bacterium]